MESRPETSTLRPRSKRWFIVSIVAVVIALGISFVVLSDPARPPLQITYFPTESPDYGPYLKIENVTSSSVRIETVKMDVRTDSGWADWGLEEFASKVVPPHSSFKLKLDVLGGKPSKPTHDWRARVTLSRQLHGIETGLPRFKLIFQRKNPFSTKDVFYSDWRDMPFSIIGTNQSTGQGTTNR